MAEVLVVVEASAAAGVKKVTLEMLTLARTLGTPSAVVFGDLEVASRLGEFGAEKMGSNKQPLLIGEESEQLRVLNENHFIMHFNSPFIQLRLTYT